MYLLIQALIMKFRNLLKKTFWLIWAMCTGGHCIFVLICNVVCKVLVKCLAGQQTISLKRCSLCNVNYTVFCNQTK